MDTLSIRHRGKVRQFRLRKGGYDFDGKLISIAVETWAEDETSPYSALFSLVNYPICGGILKQGMELTFKDDHAAGCDDEITHANAYFDFHAESVELTFKILAVDSGFLRVELSAITEDYGYDDDGRKLNPMVGIFRLPKRAKNELWKPT